MSRSRTRSSTSRRVKQASSDDTRALIAAHEMTHGMGAVPTEAPHSCDSGHVCDSPSDLMKAVFQQGDSLGNVLARRRPRRLLRARRELVGRPQLRPALRPRPEPRTRLPTIVNFTATDNAGFVRVDWAPSAPQPGLYYRLYDENGALDER